MTLKMSLNCFVRVNGGSSDRRNVYAVISGRNKGVRGEAHKIAVKLGLKNEIKISDFLGESKSNNSKIKK